MTARSVPALAAIAGLGLALVLHAARPQAVRRVLDRLAAWYDAHDGLGRPCASGELRAYRPGPDFELMLPSCWSATSVDVKGVKVHQLQDPAPGVGSVALWTAAAAGDGTAWKRFEASVRAAGARPAARTERRDGLTLVTASGGSGEPSDPWLTYEWLISDGRTGLSVGYRVQKVFVRSEQVETMLERIQAMVASVSFHPAHAAEGRRLRGAGAPPGRLEAGRSLRPMGGKS